MTVAGRSRDPVAWVLDADPAIRWRVLADLLGASDDVVEAERARVATEGWGAVVLSAQDPDGLWAGTYYSPKWTSTTYSLLLLHWLGLNSDHPRARLGCRRLLDSAREVADGLVVRGAGARPDVCVTAMMVLLGARFGDLDDRIDRVTQSLLHQALADGGWNCRGDRGAKHSSFHTTISVLDAFVEYLRAGGTLDVGPAMARAREFLLEHRLFRSHRTGAVANEAFTRSHFPPQWHYDIVRGLEHFRSVGAAPDERLRDAVSTVRSAQRGDGTWSGHTPYTGRYWFPFGAQDRSRWATLRALRIVRWWDDASGGGAGPMA